MKKAIYFMLPIVATIILCGFLFIAYNKPISADSCPFVNDLHIGDESNEVALLQLFLVRSGYYKEAMVTGYFGSLTSKAVKKFQQANGVYTVGFVGPDTRKALCNKYTTSCPFITSSLKQGVTSNEVKMLQLMLISQTNFPSNMITGYFGPLTESHLKAFQSDNNLVASGIVDSNTQQKLCTLYANTISSMTSTGLASTGGNIDLAVSDLSYAPTQNIQVGSTILFGIKERNLGTADAPAHSYDLYINEYRLVSENLNSLKAGQERAVNIQQWTCSQPGIYYFKIILDPINDIVESNKLNNTLTTSVNCGNVVDTSRYSCNTSTWQCVLDSSGNYSYQECSSVCKVGGTTLADLTLSNFSPQTFTVGQETTISITEKNIGSVVAGYHYLTAYIGNDATQEAQVGQSTLLYSLDPGASRTNQFKFTCPAEGNYNLKFIIDSQYNVKEDNKNNNILIANIQCTTGSGSYSGTYKFACDTVSKKCIVDTQGLFNTPEDCMSSCSKSTGVNPGIETEQPNLQLNIDNPGNCQGNKFVMPFVIYNAGGGKAGAFKVAIFKDTLTSTPVCTANVSSLEPGKTVKVNCDYVCQDANAHNLYFMVDYGNQIAESNENDNIVQTASAFACPSGCVGSANSGGTGTGGDTGGGTGGGGTGGGGTGSGRTGLYLSWFTVQPSDVNTIVDNPISGGLKPYRKAPHTPVFSWSIYNYSGNGAKCTLNFGDGSSYDCSWTGFGSHGAYESTTGSGGQQIDTDYRVCHTYTSAGKYCPTITYCDSTNNCQTSKPTNAFANATENSEKCIIIYNDAPYSLYGKKAEPCYGDPDKCKQDCGSGITRDIEDTGECGYNCSPTTHTCTRVVANAQYTASTYGSEEAAKNACLQACQKAGGSLTVSCTGTITNSSNCCIKWESVVNGGSPSYSYKWTGDLTSSYSGSEVCYLTSGTKKVNLVVTDSTNKTASTSCEAVLTTSKCGSSSGGGNTGGGGTDSNPWGYKCSNNKCVACTAYEVSSNCRYTTQTCNNDCGSSKPDTTPNTSWFPYCTINGSTGSVTGSTTNSSTLSISLSGISSSCNYKWYWTNSAQGKSNYVMSGSGSSQTKYCNSSLKGTNYYSVDVTCNGQTKSASCPAFVCN